jgi:undecaprenyl-diphosphatase
MNDYVLALILGVVEGVTEFLPVSSTAHLRLTQKLLGLSLENEYWKFFAVFIQLGAILAVMVYYRARLKEFASEGISLLKSKPAKLISHPIGLIGIAFVVTAGPAFLLKKVIGENLESIRVMAGSLFIGGVIMIVVDLIFSKRGRTDTVEKISPWQAFLVGAAQIASAVFPGTSRSMSTIAAGQVSGLSRAAALEFSFLLSIPIMIVATLYDMFKYVKQSGGAGFAFTGEQFGALVIGFVVSFLVAYAAVAWFLRYVRKHGFVVFGIYRILLVVLMFFAFGI